MKKLVCMLALLTGTICSLQAQSNNTVTPATQDTAVTAFIGKYTFPDGSVVEAVEVKLDSTGLNMISDAGTSVLQKLGVDSFALVSFQGTAVFKRDENNKVKMVVIDAMGYHLEGKKEEKEAVTPSVTLWYNSDKKANITHSK
ncbi:MAG: hypothetical protein KGK14_01075 [Bacteroidota bacterium]|jgi:hypothetical protein|nr:hypothetical protein [Bacteroidota bacterium]